MSSEIIAVGPYRSTQLRKEEDGDYVAQILQVLHNAPHSVFLTTGNCAVFKSGRVTIRIYGQEVDKPLEILLSNGDWWALKVGRKQKRRIRKYFNKLCMLKNIDRDATYWCDDHQYVGAAEVVDIPLGEYVKLVIDKEVKIGGAKYKLIKV